MPLRKKVRMWKYRHHTLVSCVGILWFFIMLMTPVVLLAVAQSLI